MHHTCKAQLKQTYAMSDGIMYFVIIQHIKGLHLRITFACL